MMSTRDLNLAKLVQQSCIQAAKEGFQDALISGLCADGAMEAAISQIQMLNLETIISKTDNSNIED